MKVPKARRLPSGTWFLQLRLGGESISITGATEKYCVTQAQLIKAEYLAGQREARLAAPKKLPTLSKAIDAYIDDRSNILSPATIRGYRRIQTGRFKTLMDRSLSDLSDQVWQAAVNVEATLCSPKTLKNAWGFLRSVVKDAGGRPLPGILLPQVSPNERPFLDPDEVKVFIQAVNGSKYEIGAFLALHSLRRSEIFALQWENVDLKKNRITVRGALVMDENDRYVQKKENKTRTSTRTVPILMPELSAALAAEQQPSGPVVPYSPDTLRRAVNRICAKAGLPKVGTHGLRHSFASLAYHLGVPDKIAMELGGWSDLQTMRRIYTHIAKQDMDRYTAAFGDFFSPEKKQDNAGNG